jgi:hypothetical protein
MKLLPVVHALLAVKSATVPLALMASLATEGLLVVEKCSAEFYILVSKLLLCVLFSITTNLFIFRIPFQE